MAELISEEQPRIKFQCERVGSCAPLTQDTPGLQALITLCQRMEALGAAPVLNDGLVGGNAGLLVDLPPGSFADADTTTSSSTTSTAAVAGSSGSNAETAAGAAHGSNGGPTLFVTRSGKPPALHMTPEDFVAVTGFDTKQWKAWYRSSNPDYRPSSDTPLLIACLSGSSAARHHWGSQPRVALHGHALAEGEGLEAARQLGLPISEHATLFSTPPDLQQLELLLAEQPFPQQRCFIRRGHGFFILGEDVSHAEDTFDELVVPFLLRQQQQQQQQQM